MSGCRFHPHVSLDCIQQAGGIHCSASIANSDLFSMVLGYLALFSTSLFINLWNENNYEKHEHTNRRSSNQALDEKIIECIGTCKRMN